MKIQDERLVALVRVQGSLNNLNKESKLNCALMQARDLRIEALEADNYGDAGGGGGGDDSDDAYDIESDLDAGGPSSAKTRRTDSRSRAAATTAASTYV